jgi:hypothetical protein
MALGRVEDEARVVVDQVGVGILTPLTSSTRTTGSSDSIFPDGGAAAAVKKSDEPIEPEPIQRRNRLLRNPLRPSRRSGSRGRSTDTLRSAVSRQAELAHEAELETLRYLMPPQAGFELWLVNPEVALVDQATLPRARAAALTSPVHAATDDEDIRHTLLQFSQVACRSYKLRSTPAEGHRGATDHATLSRGRLPGAPACGTREHGKSGLRTAKIRRRASGNGLLRSPSRSPCARFRRGAATAKSASDKATALKRRPLESDSIAPANSPTRATSYAARSALTPVHLLYIAARRTSSASSWKRRRISLARPLRPSDPEAWTAAVEDGRKEPRARTAHPKAPHVTALAVANATLTIDGASVSAAVVG